MEIIMVVLAAIVAALLVGPAVAIGAIVDSRKVRALAVLLRSRLEATSEELGGALVRAGRAEHRVVELKTKLELFEDDSAALWLERAEARREVAAKEKELRRAQAQVRVAQGAAIERGELIAELKAEIAHLHTVLSEDGVKIESLRAEVASLRKQRRYLVGQRNSLMLSARGLTADAEGASREAVALRTLNGSLMAERGETLKRSSAANKRVKALEAFINKAYGPVDECEIGSRICGWCETQDFAGGNTCEVCDQPF